MSLPVPPRRLWLLLLGFCLWAIALVVLYGAHAIGCSFGWPTGALRLGLTIAFLLHLAAVGWLWHAERAPRTDSAGGATGTFFHEVVAWVTIAAFATVILTLGPSLLLKTCL